VAAAALRRKKTYEQQLEQLAGTRLTLEAQANAIESANMNAETMLAMKRGAGALKDIHKQLNIDKVDATMDEIREEMERTKEIAEAISNPMNVGMDLDEVRFEAMRLVATVLRTKWLCRMRSRKKWLR
jgi:charged multivesicular body protein 4A/B